MKPDTEVPVPQLDVNITTDLPPMDGGETTAPATEGEPVKRRRRRRKVTPTQPDIQPVEDPATIEEANFAQALAMGFEFGGRIAAGIRGDHWLFKPDETATLGAVWAKALIPYMGKLAPYTPFIVATVVTAGYMMPKIQQDRLLAAANMTQIRRPTLAAVDGPSALNVAHAVEQASDIGGGSPELHQPELPPDSIGGAAARRNRKRNENPPGVI